MTPLPGSGSDLETELQRVARRLRALPQISVEGLAVVQAMLDRWVSPAAAPDLKGRSPAQVADVVAALAHDVRTDDGCASMAEDLAGTRRALS